MGLQEIKYLVSKEFRYNISSGLNITFAVPLFTRSSIVALHVNFSFKNVMLYVFSSTNLTIANPEISLINGVFTLMNLYSLGFGIILSFGKIGSDLF